MRNVFVFSLIRQHATFHAIVSATCNSFCNSDRQVTDAWKQWLVN